MTSSSPSAAGQWWVQISGRERITIVSILAGAIVVIVNAISWPIALCYIQRQQTIARISEGVLSDEAATAATRTVGEIHAINGQSDAASMSHLPRHN